MRETFASADESWRAAVLHRGRVVIGQALDLRFTNEPNRGEFLISFIVKSQRWDTQKP